MCIEKQEAGEKNQTEGNQTDARGDREKGRDFRSERRAGPALAPQQFDHCPIAAR